MTTDLITRKWRGLIAVALLATPIFAACSKPSVGGPVPVPLHGVNHHMGAFSYVLVDPTNPRNTGGGELIDSFSAGGTMCCYTLPEKWRPGIKIEIQETHWLPRLPDDSLPQESGTYVVELPPYGEGTPGELWVIRKPDGGMDIVSSNYQPDHPKWPGKIKGWPVPSIEYQRERHDLYIHEAEVDVNLYISSLKELKDNPIAHAEGEWKMSSKYHREDLKGYKGPSDPAYLEGLRKYYESCLIEERAKLQRLKEARP